MTSSPLSRFLLLAILAWPAGALPQDSLGPEERAEVDHMRRRGEVTEALEILDEVLGEEPEDAATRVLRARCRFDRCDYAGALSDAERAQSDASAAARSADDRSLLASAARERAAILVELGRAAEALAALDEAGAAIDPAGDPRDGWALGTARLAAGQRAQAFEAFRAGGHSTAAEGWERLLARGRCLRALGDFRAAASALVAADAAASQALGTEPDVLAELGDLYFEVYGEVADRMSDLHSPAELYQEALDLRPGHEGALLGAYHLNRANWNRRHRTPEEILADLFAARPESVRGLLARTSSALDDGHLPRARKALAQLLELAPGRRDVRTEQAALLWIEHRRDEARALLGELAAEDADDSRPEREVGRHLLELYRYAEGLPFLEAAVGRDARDWIAQRELGNAYANTGDETAARAALARAKAVAEGRKDAWRDNMARVLERLATESVEHDVGDFTFVWRPDAAPVWKVYLVPFYRQAREELAARYGHTPEPVRIEIFRRWADFSVRSTGFEGFPALGVCFGPVVTAVSPLSEMRGRFSWASTAFHEFTHVIHLGLSHNRCPRWITEGLATWEEGTRRPMWWRDMRREMIDARAALEVIPIRELNGAFRGPRILFAYYQGGLLCEMLIEQHGFTPVVRLLEAFDRGLDLDAAFREVYQRTPEEVDVAFGEFLDVKFAGLVIEPRWSPRRALRLRLRTPRRPPAADAGEEALASWKDAWSTIAWSAFQQGRTVDAEEALRVLTASGDLPSRAHFLRAELLVMADDAAGARAAFEAGFEAGGDGYRARMGLATLLLAADEVEAATLNVAAAERLFPGFPDPRGAAELSLAKLHEAAGDVEAAMATRLRWLAYQEDDVENRWSVARWLDEQGRHAQSTQLYEELNEIDPFRRALHLRWGAALAASGRHAEALREFEVGVLVPAHLDLDVGPPPDADGERAASWKSALATWQAQEAELLGWQARTLLELERPDEARAAAEAALALDEDEDRANEVLDSLR